jgi:hopanoid biosynthesis associated protein HpnK
MLWIPSSGALQLAVDTLDRVKRLILNADDFGFTDGVNRAIVELHALGSLTSTTLMARAAATDAAARGALENPKLGVGCHIVLVDGVPTLPPEKLPTLVEQSTGRFRNSLGSFVRDLLLGRIREREIQAEAEAQIGSLQARGLALTHIDTHKHTHMFPRVLGPILQAARLHGIAAIRNPFEPSWSVAATAGAPLLRKMQVQMLNQFRSPFARLTNGAGLATTDGAIGVLATGTLDTPTLNALLSAMPDGVWELVTHPGYLDDALAGPGTRLIASREVELRALESQKFSAGMELIHFGHLSRL